MYKTAMVAATLATTAAAGLPAAGHAAPGGPPPSPTHEATGLVQSAKALRGAAPQRSALLKIAERARSHQRAGRYCAAVNTAAQLRTRIDRAPAAAQQRLLATDAAALSLQQRLLLSPKTKGCGGGAGQANVDAAEPTLKRSDARAISMTVELPEVGFGTTRRAGKLWTKLGAPNASAAGKLGEPAIPTASFQIAVPEGAKLRTEAIAGSSYKLKGVRLLPVQREPVDAVSKAPNFAKGAFATPPFVKPSRSYRRAYPAQRASATLDGRARGLRMATVQVPLAKYEGGARKLTVYRSIKLDISFDGATAFGGELSPWDRVGASVQRSVLNRAAVEAALAGRFRLPGRCGEEFLIITAPAMRASADKLALARNAAGIRTHVFETVPGGAGTTKEQIRDFIRARATSQFCVRPGYVLLLGNDEFVPTFELTYGTSDLPYATTDDADTLPDLAQARIPGNATEVDTAIDKIFAYGTTPLPANAKRTAMLAAQFQDDDGDGQEDRTYIQFSETIANGLTARGNTVKRIYGEKPAGDPQKLVDGTDLPASLTKPAFAWDGDGSDVSDAWNAGTFLGIHRDHGWSDGWGTPYFTTADVENLTNTALPVLMSINCSSGAYDRDDTSFVTRALGMAGGGAVAVFGDTEDSPSTHNSVQGIGFVDALLPSVVPAEGPATKQRLGDAMVYGKLRLNSYIPAATSNSTKKEHQIWTLFGDPTMRMQGGGAPLRFDPADLVARLEPIPGLPDPGPLTPNYRVVVTGLPAELRGQNLSLRKGGEVVGQGFADGGQAAIQAVFGDGSVKPGELAVVIDAPTDGPPVVVPVASAPAPAPRETPEPSPAPAATTLELSCPAAVSWWDDLSVGGTLAGAPAGAGVAVRFEQIEDVQGATPATPVIVDVPALTDADGHWTAVMPSAREHQGRWNVTAQYAGDGAHAASTAAPCTVVVDSVKR